MSEIPAQHSYSPAGSTNWQQCVVCQTITTRNGPLVQQPRQDSFECLLQAINDRASFHDVEYCHIQRRLKDETSDSLKANKAVWHRLCYSNSTCKVKLQRAKERYQDNLSSGKYSEKRRGQKRKSTDNHESLASSSTSPFTRSATVPFDKDHCFFCQEDNEERLYTLRTENSGKALREAVQLSEDPILQTRLNTSISPTDAHAIDVQYHKRCWTQKVFHVLRAKDKKGLTEKGHPLQTSSLIELIGLIDSQTQNKAYLSMEDIETTYMNMLGGPDALANHFPAYSRHWLKERILLELPHVTSVRQKDRRKPSILYSPDACESEMVQSVLTENEMDDLNIIYKAAKVLRRCIDKFHPKEKPANSIQVTSNADDVPPELYAMVRWVMVGPAETLETEKRTTLVNRDVLTVSQTLMHGFKSQRQVNYKPKNDSATLKPHRSRETPQSVGLALTIHHDTRNKKLLERLSAQGYCVSYNRVMHLETALANAVVENTMMFQGLYIPPFLRRGAFVFFAADNTDFAEDSVDRKGTTHGTIVAVYQKATTLGEPLSPPLKMTETNSLSVTPYHVQMLQCDKPVPKPIRRTEKFPINKDGISPAYRLTQLGWLVASSITKMQKSDSTYIPGWAGYHSLLSTSQHLTEVGVLPLLPEVAHEWSTLLTVISQTTRLKNLVVGTTHPTVISFDMALYEKVIKLLDAKPDLRSTVVPRLGELYAVVSDRNVLVYYVVQMFIQISTVCILMVYINRVVIKST